MPNSFRRLIPSAVTAAFALTAALAAAPVTPLTTVRYATGFTAPVYVTHLPGDYDRLFVVQQGGQIRIIKNGTVLGTNFLNIAAKVSSTGERGLLGLAFHPDYNTNGQFYLNYTNTSGNTVIARYKVSANPDVADAASELILMTISQPFSNHNGGWIDFGPDGYLYIASGDGGDGGDPGNRAQDITNQLLGKMLRIDVDGDDFPMDSTRNYAIPPDNPFVGITGDDEIWAYGLRNPWRCSFDRLTHDLYIADVGQNAREEVNFQPASDPGGLNYGWRCMEGTNCTGLSGCTCNAPALTLPIHEYAHPLFTSNSITGGYVYRGCAIKHLPGSYFFADYVRNLIWSFRYDGATLTELEERTSELVPDIGVLANISSFGEDAHGEMYIINRGSGAIYKLIADEPLVDCNGNGIADACDIAAGHSLDLNSNGVPDECDPPVPAVSEWGLVVLTLLVFSAGTIILASRPRAEPIA